MELNFEQNQQVIEATTEAGALVARLQTIAIATHPQYLDAGVELTRIKGQRKRLEDLRKSLTGPLDEAKRRIMDFFRAPTERLDAAEMTVKRAMVSYSDAQERAQREEQARLDALARKEREKLEAQAAKAAEAGKAERSELLEQRAAAIVAPIAQREAPKVEGISFREVAKFEVENEALVPREYLMVDESKIRRVVGALKLEAKIPGVRVWIEKQAAARAS